MIANKITDDKLTPNPKLKTDRNQAWEESISTIKANSPNPTAK
jgi:hypothetical protein